MEARSVLLTAYDVQLRRETEMLTATEVTYDGPLVRGLFDRSGFVTYRDLEGLAGKALDQLIGRTIGYFRDETGVEEFEWKTRGHDAPPDLGDRLSAAGFAADAQETVMIGEAGALAAPVEIPGGVRLRRLDPAAESFAGDVERMAALQAVVFGGTPRPDELVRRLLPGPGLAEAWVAEAGGEVICAGRLEVVSGTEFGGLWGGGTLDRWRGRGIYRALVAARSQSALDLGVRFLHSDCTEMSRPILQRSGLSPVTTTTPFVWKRDQPGA